MYCHGNQHLTGMQWRMSVHSSRHPMDSGRRIQWTVDAASDVQWTPHPMYNRCHMQCTMDATSEVHLNECALGTMWLAQPMY